MNPAGARFTATESRAADDCHGCIFEHERTSVCRGVEAIAKRLELPDCETKAPSGKTYIYVLDKRDPRQMDLLKTTEE